MDTRELGVRAAKLFEPVGLVAFVVYDLQLGQHDLPIGVKPADFGVGEVSRERHRGISKMLLDSVVRLQPLDNQDHPTCHYVQSSYMFECWTIKNEGRIRMTC